MFCLITHYDDKEMSQERSPDRDVISKIQKVNLADKNAIACFLYDGIKLITYIFNRA